MSDGMKPDPTRTRRTPPRDPAVPASPAPRSAGDDRSIGELIRELGQESSTLVREEVALAKAEMKEKLRVYERNAAKIAVGGVLLLGALGVLLVAVNRGFTALLAPFMGVELAVWIAPLILAAVIAGIGWSMVKGGKEAIANEGVAPKRTIETAKEEKQWIENELK